MNQENYWVEVVQYGEPERIVKTMGPFFEHIANNVRYGECRNMNHEEYFARVVKK